ncbi:hypothetical protein QBC34DRAFT_386361 [Podospora aff. communis PSN243]|uniref:Ankyrin repeat protein n=1 Tax=Podospora aff. communis PSN243 TaxID=3040156 RepID=A0AAV9G7J2_9PEZI|nr:hypothetical protein QBC34DRAFT_386361 [Podospora aff. communis PSN243]
MTQALSLLLANVDVSAKEAYELLLTAIRVERLKAMAAISAAMNQQHRPFQGGGLRATKLAVRMKSHLNRYKTLAFLLSAGATADTPELRDQLLLDAKCGRLSHVQLLIKAGVPSHKAEANVLQWAVEILNSNILDVLLEGHIPPDAASRAVASVPMAASEADKIRFVSALAQKGASSETLGPLLLRAVQDAHPRLTDLLLQLGATSEYRLDDSQNALCAAAKRGDVALMEKLCRANPTALVPSEALPLAFDGLASPSRLNDLLRALEILIVQGACGTAIDDTVLKALGHPGREKILATLLPAGILSSTAGQAVDFVIRQSGTESLLMLICDNATVTGETIQRALEHVFYSNPEVYDEKKASVLSGTANRHGYRDALDQLLVNPARDTHPKANQIADLLLADGANINFGDSHVLVAAATSADPSRVAELLR